MSQAGPPLLTFEGKMPNSRVIGPFAYLIEVVVFVFLAPRCQKDLAELPRSMMNLGLNDLNGRPSARSKLWKHIGHGINYRVHGRMQYYAGMWWAASLFAGYHVSFAV